MGNRIIIDKYGNTIIKKIYNNKKGRILYTNGDIFEGTFIKSSFYTRLEGVLITDIYKYDNDIIINSYDMYKEYKKIINSGIVYTGTFDTLSGTLLKGTILYINNDKYIGTFKNNMLYGNGIKYVNNVIYKGTFINNMLNGKGCIMYPNMYTINGTFKNDIPNGNMELIMNKKIIYLYLDNNLQSGNYYNCIIVTPNKKYIGNAMFIKNDFVNLYLQN